MIEELSDGITLYHGSYIEVKNPDISYCAKYKDFGQGFYLTTDRDQADNFALISLRKAVLAGVAKQEQNYGVVSAFKYTANKSLKSVIYQNTDSEWLRCIVAHRQKKSYPTLVNDLSLIDIIGGKIANDNTNATINVYMTGGYGKVGTTNAENICISLLLPERLKDQYCFRTPKALGCLTFLWSRRCYAVR